MIQSVIAVTLIVVFIRNCLTVTHHLKVLKKAFTLTATVSLICLIIKCLALSFNDNFLLNMTVQTILLLISLSFSSFYILISLIPKHVLSLL